LSNTVSSYRPDVLWASSDAVHAVLAARLGKKFGLPFVIDLYDDYESFGLSRLPGMRSLLRRACARADALTVVSRTLAATIRDRLPQAPRIEVIGNGVPGFFCSRLPRHEARLRLGLPLEVPLIGTAGALDRTRGIGDLFQAFRVLRSSRPDARLVVAGPRDAALARELDQDVIDLGTIPHEQVAWLYSALDVGVVCNRDSAFARACYPQKLAEMLACKLPLVAAAVGDTALILRDCPQCLFSPGDSQTLARQIECQLASPVLPELQASRWSELARGLEDVLQRAVAAS
jgi:glycosyltransferase involved in cell wall biosynthesis